MEKQNYVLHSLVGRIRTICPAVYPDTILLLDGGRRIRNHVLKFLGKKMADIRPAVVSHKRPDRAGAAPVLFHSVRSLMMLPPGTRKY